MNNPFQGRSWQIPFLDRLLARAVKVHRGELGFVIRMVPVGDDDEAGFEQICEEEDDEKKDSSPACIEQLK